jgi:Excalibur calcium-binding domain
MKKIIGVAIVGLLGWKGYSKYQEHNLAASEPPSQLSSTQEGPVAIPPSASFTCDGRTHCSQMTSCAEATYFIQHCPDTKMDGNNDGVPCEKQHCK